MIPKWARVAFFAVVLLVPVGLPVGPAFGQVADTDPKPLRPADTSSPRATLRGFVADASEVIEAWRRGEPSAPSARAYLRALQALDFSATPNGGSWATQTTRVLLLMELLSRVEIPPDEAIPGDREVAEGRITRWRLPDTPIAIGRIESGPRAGEFLFTAETVAALDRLYRQAKHLPYRPGATRGLYEAHVGSDLTVEAGEAELRNRLRPTDTSSPRSTLEGFLDSVNRAYALVLAADAALKATPPAMTMAEARAAEARANNLIQRATATLDLNQVPEALRDDVSVEAVLQLKEILDRMQLPPVNSIPNARMVAAARSGELGEFAQTGGPLRWRLPNTEIDIVEITEGERQGEFLFSAGTVGRLHSYFERVRDLPYRTVRYDAIENEYRSPGTSPDFYDYYITTPGYLVPRSTLLGRWLDGLPDWLKEDYGDQTLWQWLATLFCVPALALVAYVVYRAIKRSAALLQSPWKHWAMVAPPVVIAMLIVGVRQFLDKDLNLTGEFLAVILAVSRTVVLFLSAWAAWNVFKAVAETIIASPRIAEGGIDASLLRILASILGTLAGVWIVLDGLQALGADIVPLLAGLGVGGLAVALAVRPTLENLIGGLILYFDKPVRVGDFCSFGGQTGTVEAIGLRSTVVRGLDRTRISVPNAKFADMEIVNWAHCDQMLIRSTIGLRYETEPDQLRYVLVKMRELFHAHPKIERESVRVRFAGYGASSLDIDMRVYALTRDWNEYFAIREDIYLRINDIVADSGSSFAFPSQTLYMGRDKGLDAERGEAAMQEVAAWRKSGKLPFPRLSTERMEELEGSLDFPPQGSVEASTLRPQRPEKLSSESLPAEDESEDLRKR